MKTKILLITLLTSQCAFADAIDDLNNYYAQAQQQSQQEEIARQQEQLMQQQNEIMQQQEAQMEQQTQMMYNQQYQQHLNGQY